MINMSGSHLPGTLLSCEASEDSQNLKDHCCRMQSNRTVREEGSGEGNKKWESNGNASLKNEKEYNNMAVIKINCVNVFLQQCIDVE